MKKTIPLFVFVSVLLLVGYSQASSHLFDFSFGAGYIKPFCNIQKIGDDFFGAGAGKEWKELIGLTKVGGSYFLTGNFRYYASDRIALEANIDYWKKTMKTKAESFESIEVDNKFRDFSFGSNILLVFKKGKRQNYIGGGMALHFLQASINPLGFPEIAEKNAKHKIGPYIIAGSERDISKKMAIFAAMRFDYVPGWNQLKIYAGIRFRI